MRETIAIVSEAIPTEAGGLFTLAPDFVIKGETLRNATAINIAEEAGLAGKFTVTIGGTYAIGDQVKVTVASNLTSRQKFVKTYTVEVTSALAGNNNAIASALEAKFAAELGAGLIDYPFSASSVATNVVTVTQNGDDSKGLEVYAHADSGAGTVAIVVTNTTISEGQPSDLVDAGIPADKIVSAQYKTIIVPFNLEVAQPFIDSKGVVVKELKIFASATTAPTYATELQTLIDAL